MSAQPNRDAAPATVTRHLRGLPADTVMVPVDPDGRRHWRELAKAIGAMCSFQQCRKRPVLDTTRTTWTTPGYCGVHAVDDVAVQRAMHGDRIHLWPHERVDAVRRLARRAVPDSEIARFLHIDPRSVLRIRAEHHIPSLVPLSVLPESRPRP